MNLRTTLNISKVLLVSTGLLASSIISAQEADAQASEQETKLWSGEVEFGYGDASGNTNESSTKSRGSVDRESESWRYNVFFESLNSKSSGVRTAEKYFVSNRLAYQFSENNYAFAFASYDEDRFSGFDYQASVAAGYGRRILNNEVMQWDVEVGPGYTKSNVTDETTGDSTESPMLRAFTKYVWDFSETATFSQVFDVETSDDNTKSRSLTSLSTQIVGALSLKLSYSFKYNDTVPTGTKHKDTETIVTLAYKF